MSDKRICGAKAKTTGKPCQRAPMANGRCHLHGGKSLGGLASPSFKHGRYSKYLPPNLLGDYHSALNNPELIDLSEEVALMDARLAQLVSNIDGQSSQELWRDIMHTWTQLMAAIQANDVNAQRALLNDLDAMIRRGSQEADRWRDILHVVSQKQRLVEGQQRLRTAEREMIPVSQAMMVLSVALNTFLQAVTKHVSDRDTAKAVIVEANAGYRTALGVSPPD